MKMITDDEYWLRLRAFVADEKEKLPVDRRPQGVFSHWGFHSLCKQLFDKRLKKEGIKVIRPVVEWPEQTGKIPG